MVEAMACSANTCVMSLHAQHEYLRSTQCYLCVYWRFTVSPDVKLTKTDPHIMDLTYDSPLRQWLT